MTHLSIPPFPDTAATTHPIPRLPFPLRRVAGLPTDAQPHAIGQWLEQKTRNGDLCLPQEELDDLRAAAALLEAWVPGRPWGPWGWFGRKRP